MGVSTTHPWEFISESPARSAVGPALACGAPHWLLKFVLYVDWLWARALHAAMEGYSAGGGCHGNGLRESFAAILDVVYRGGGGGGGGDGASGGGGGEEWRWRGDMTPPFAVVVAPRLFLFLASLLLDVAADGAARAVYWARKSGGGNGNGNGSRSGSGSGSWGGFGSAWAGAADAGINARLVLASCWPVLTMQMRPFSNSLEVRLVPSYEPYAFQAVLAIRFDP